MSHRHVLSAVGAALLSAVTVVTAQTNDQTAPATTRQTSADETPITLVGCLQRESDYRKQQDVGRGSQGTGLGLGNEFVLINASRAGSTSAVAMDCSSASSGDAYELTGKAERDLAPFVGKTVEISGMLKKADIDDDAPAGTSGSTRPSGGFDPLGQDLRLHEVNVMSFRAVTAQAQASAAAPAAPAPAEPEAAGTAGSAQQSAEQQELPGTASPLPLAGLLGLLSLAGALGVRRLR